MIPEPTDCRFRTLRVISHRNRPNRDKEVVRLVSMGLTAAQIAEIGGLTERGVVMIITLLKKKHNCKNTPHLVAYFLRNKIID